ncbi:hypothetical protein [Anaerococcus sp. Marseille-P3625]|uniref:hypothetical protein n=1 Tax=Anaerococcus sp. Marseille-P3625 TaxID=1977277 RepID=UPI000C085DAE|nr:hypothetical protein [Anaerococcus sp. Marseille-P3625]
MTDSLIIFVLVLIAGSVLTLTVQGIKEAKAKAQLIENELLRYATDQVLELAEIIVGSINQTIVDPLKNSPELNFDEEAQKEAFNGAKTAIKKNLNDKSKEILSKTHDDLDSYLTDVVEAEVRKQKK